MLTETVVKRVVQAPARSEAVVSCLDPCKDWVAAVNADGAWGEWHYCLVHQLADLPQQLLDLVAPHPVNSGA